MAFFFGNDLPASAEQLLLFSPYALSKLSV